MYYFNTSFSFTVLVDIHLKCNLVSSSSYIDLLLFIIIIIIIIPLVVHYYNSCPFALGCNRIHEELPRHGSDATKEQQIEWNYNGFKKAK